MQLTALNIIPKPAETKMLTGAFVLSRDFLVYGSTALPANELTVWLDLLHQCLPQDCNAQYQITPNGHAANLLISINPDCCDAKPEAYVLRVTTEQIQITATDTAGVFYALQSLTALIRTHRKQAAIPCCEITDYPRYAWRGFMLDSARHFQEVAWIKQHIDRMAALKLNRLHWHLCDDQAWRAQVDAYPKLTDIAAWRTENGKRYGGYYTKNQMRDIVQYARDRHITVIPEIEIPGHCNSALVAYPELSCSGEAIDIDHDGWDAYTQSAGRFPYCAGKPQVYAFLKTVLSEMAEIFTQQLHIGGDETPGEKWDQCPVCSAIKTKLGLTTNIALRTHVLGQIHDHVQQTLDRQTIAWTDGVDDQIPNGQIVHAWFAHEAATAARKGYAVINSNHEWVYLDYPALEADRPTKPDWMLVLPLEKVYHFDPTPEGLEKEYQTNILGSESPIWTEYAENEKALEKQIFPRLIAFAEALWSPKLGRSFDEFAQRLEQYEHSKPRKRQALSV
ncbi:MAG TPA: hypothetical protein DCM28_20590 [Phycisphaerales bacterium]|nr:hypothetical protein [Phycisphaerales bacterium]HCD34352.1 hypothetical protein [Phycisphaerales bacterium]|tara:strand:+ start:7798 stop:9315 length:1518 start_codon:yes stop_codon:yes gene_type:complete